MDKQATIEKVKLLLRLASNTSENEANTAKIMAEKLIERHKLTEEEYTEKEIKSIYSDDDLMFQEIIPTEWRSALALVCANKFDCYVIKEENKNILTNDCVFRFYVYGYPDDVSIVKILFQNVSAQIEKIVENKCKDKDTLYISSFYEGLVNGAKINIQYENFDVDGIIKKSEEAPQIEMRESKSLEKVKEPKKEKPIETTTAVYQDEKPINIYGYLTAEKIALNDIHIGKLDPLKQKWLEVENYDDDLWSDLNIKLNYNETSEE